MSEHRKDILDQYNSFSTTLVALVKDRVRVMYSYIKPIREGSRIVGTAYTVNEEDNCLDMLDKMKPGQVVVIAAGGHREFAVWGQFNSFSAICHGAQGVIVDGSIGGINALRESELPVFSRSITPLFGRNRHGARVNVPIKCAGVLVNPGDIIIGDDDGVVVVPTEEADTVAIAAQNIKEVLDIVRKEMIQEKKPTDKVRHIDELYAEKNKGLSDYWKAYGPWLEKYGKK